MQTAAQTVKVRIIAVECPSYNGSGCATVSTIKIRLRSPVKVEECLKNMFSRIQHLVFTRENPCWVCMEGGGRVKFLSIEQVSCVANLLTACLPRIISAVQMHNIGIGIGIWNMMKYQYWYSMYRNFSESTLRTVSEDTRRTLCGAYLRSQDYRGDGCDCCSTGWAAKTQSQKWTGPRGPPRTSRLKVGAWSPLDF